MRYKANFSTISASPAKPDGLARVHKLHLPHTLADYRDRYALHKSDPDLQLAHTVAPWIVTWDDREVQNDYVGSWGKGGTSAEFLLSRTAAWQAFYEHMPLRASSLAANDGFHSLQLYRRFRWGQLANIHLLDAHPDTNALCQQGRVVTFIGHRLFGDTEGANHQPGKQQDHD